VVRVAPQVSALGLERGPADVELVIAASKVDDPQATLRTVRTSGPPIQRLSLHGVEDDELGGECARGGERGSEQRRDLLGGYGRA